jgi:hypothetical protein
MRDDSFVRIKPSAFVRAIVRSSRTVMRPTNIAGGFARNDAVVKLPQYWSNFIHIGAKSARPSAPTPTGVKAIGLSATPFELHSRSSTIISGVKPALNQRVPITERPATWAVKDLGSLMTIGGCRPLMKHELKKGSVVLSKTLIFRPYNVFAVDSSRRRCARWRCRELRVYRAFSGGGLGSFHRSPARTSLCCDFLQHHHSKAGRH